MRNTANLKPKTRQSNLPLTKLPYFDIKRQHEPMQGEVMAALEKVYASGAYILGPALKDFECQYARYVGTPYAAGAFTFTATALAPLHLGAVPVFADVDPISFTLDPQSLQKALSRKTRAVIPVHLFGQCADMDAIGRIAKSHRIKVIEDACQAHGAMWNGKKAGSLGDAGAFSFYPTKNLGGIGDGGIVTTSNERMYRRILQYRNLGKSLSNAMVHDEVGWTSRLDSLQAAFLSIKLGRLDALNETRRTLAKRFEEKLSPTPVISPGQVAGAQHVYHIYVVRVPDGQRDALKEYLAQEGIPSMVHYEIPVHRQPIMRRHKTRKVPLPVTEKLKKEVLTLPFYPGMTESEVDLVATAIKKFYR
ncbi:MAG: dTDP-3-amino-3,6-dideoxy-alpha-D-galactopyranose transaminase [Candidatus Omnitrophica bacterium ADurb.Bin314]|nr:MAG: dTDP-3-amino-3,6-dideoxy-alpha-D-galactopyranose transaminase [Candidatus Omnitrophica bacterium ADurb.Bin314]